ncbi:hypothetical protein [Streptomyces zaomyceticus]|uniref:hypothetical protein n=1 Tax=Streptomyces zaomyceticus TaxID=68286 RepID=UPI0037A1DADF
MSLVTRDLATGLRRGPVCYPDGRPPTPYGCRWCGTEQSGHGQRWKASVGLHRWEQPTRVQILARMRARRNARLNTPPAYHGATVHSTSTQGCAICDLGPAVCADCGTTTCTRWNRIRRRLFERQLQFPVQEPVCPGEGTCQPF